MDITTGIHMWYWKVHAATPMLSPESKQKLDVKRLLKYYTFDNLVLVIFYFPYFILIIENKTRLIW